MEYLLLVLLSIIIVTMASLQLFQPFRQWASIYLGSYIECLLDAGELPKLGSDQDTGPCEEQFEPYSFANGRRPIARGTSGSQGNDPNSSRGAAGGSVRSNTGRGLGGNLGANRGGGAGSTSSADGGEGDKKQQNLGPSGDSIASRGGGSTFTTGGSGRVTGNISMETLSEGQRRRLARRSSSTQSLGPVNEGSESDSRRKTLTIPATAGKKASFDDETEPWSFGRIFKIAFIVAVIAALVLLILLQIRQIQKGMEKGET